MVIALLAHVDPPQLDIVKASFHIDSRIGVVVKSRLSVP
jgi:hypothetical protein